MTEDTTNNSALAVVVDDAGDDLSLDAGARPAIAAWAGDHAAKRTFEFLTATIRNKNTRRAYHRATIRFMQWCIAHDLAIEDIESPHVAAYIDELATGGPVDPLTGKRNPQPLATLSVKQNLAAIKHWFDYLVTGHVLAINPAHAVRGPRYSQETGKTPVLEREQVRALLESIDAGDIAGARDRALIAVMLFSFARVGALVGMRVKDYRGAGSSSSTFTLHEKGGKFHRVPAHHKAAEYLDAYIELAGLKDTPDAMLWQSIPARTRKLSGKALDERNALKIIKRRCVAAGLPADICNHSFRATGITLHQDAGGELEAARQIAGHASVKTTQLYNRSGDKKKRTEIERVQL
jgi:site-specific recombinase XerD